MRRTAYRLVSLLALLALGLGACGVGGVQEQSFFFAPVTADGGTIDIGGARVIIPPGALPGPTAVSILPETQDQPIVTDPQDTATYEVYDARYCVAPRGLALLQGAQLRLYYDDSLLPDGYDETDDLVLLLWNEALGALVPRFGAVHDTTADYFQINDFDELGHVAVGLITRPPSPQFVFLTGTVQLGAAAPDLEAGAALRGVAAVGPGEDGLYVGDLDGDPVQFLPSEATFPQSFLPSPDGTRVLFELLVYQAGQDFATTELWSVAPGDAAATPLVGQVEFVTSYDPTHGWLRGGNDVFYEEVLLADQQQELPDRTVLSTVDGSGTQSPAELDSFGDVVYVIDVRQSPDGTLLLASFLGSNESTDIAVFDVSTRQLVSIGQIPFGGGEATPRFLPDSSGIYLVSSDRTEVLAYDPDGTNERTVFTLPAVQGRLKDFVLAPNGDDYAYIAHANPALQGVQGLVLPGDDGLYVGSLSSGARGDADLGGDYFYDELVFHPDGATVFLDGFYTGLLLFDATDASPGPDLPVQGISKIDISSVDGRLLLVVLPGEDISAGLYVADADGSNLTPVSLPVQASVLEARWMRTTRTAPCMGFVNRIR